MIILAEKILKKRLTLLFILLIAHIVSIIIEVTYGTNSFIYTLFSKWDFGTEKNFPTFFSSINLLISAMLLTLITYLHKEKKEPYFLWFGLAIIFYYLCADEFICIHEHFSRPTRNLIHAKSYLYFSWIIPYSIIVLGVVAIYLRFVLNLPKKIRNLFFICGGTFVFAAIGMEMIQANEAFMYGNANKETFIYYLSYTIEELLEMSSIILFIYTLTEYIMGTFGNISLTISKKNIES